MNKKKVAIITSGYFPVPPVKGGAVETLVNILYEENKTKNMLNLSVYSVYDKEAISVANMKFCSNIVYIKIPKFVKMFDKLSYFVFRSILRKKKHMSYRYIFQRLYYIKSVSKKIAKEDYESIVIENHPTLLGILRKFGNSDKYRGKCYYHAHNEILRTFGYAKELNELKGFLCVSNYIGNTIHTILPNYPIENIKVLRNRVDEDKFRLINSESILTFRAKHGIPNGCVLFTFIGRLTPEKGVKELLKAYKRAHPQNTKLVIAGSYFFGSGMKSEYEEELRILSEEMKDDIIYTGYLDYNDMPCMYAVSDVIVIPSIWNDPAPLTVIESLTCGKPVITTYSGGIPEYASKKNSIILDVGDDLVDNLCSAISLLSQNVDTRNYLIKNAQVDRDNWKKEDYYNEFISLIS